MHRRRHPGLVAAAAAVAALTAPSAAMAATVSMERVGVESEDAVFFERHVALAAPADEVNRLRVRIRMPEHRRTGSILFSDAGGRLRPGPGCRYAPGGVACSSAVEPILKLHIATGPGDDAVRLLATVPYGPAIRVRAGPGDDTVSGSPMKEDVFGGPGDDVLYDTPPYPLSTDRDKLNGGPGRDRLRTDDGDMLVDGERDGQASSDVYVGDDDSLLSYRSRRAAVTVDLLRGTGGGGGGERDRIIGVGGVAGGAGDDRLVGGSSSDVFLAEAGDDVVLGRGGGDMVDGGPGEDRLVGGDGRDRFQANSDRVVDQLVCGADFDAVDDQDPQDTLGADCERAGWSSGGARMAAQPVFAGRTARFSASCSNWRCAGTIELRTQPEDELVGRGSFSFTRVGRMEAALDADPAVLFPPPGRLVTVLVTVDGCGVCPIRSGFTTTFRG